MQAIAVLWVVQSPYSPEPNPVERFFRELHRAIEGRVYPNLQAKQEALEPILQAWRIREALTNLPADTQVIQS